MSYTVYVDKNAKIEIPDGVILQDGGQSTLPITLFGANVDFGESLQANMLHLLETFYAQRLPYAPVEGMLWFDGTELRVCIGNEKWMRVELNTNVGPVPSGSHYTASLLGNQKYGSTLTAAISNPTLTFTTQWYVDNVLDATKTTNTYTTTNSDVGKSIRVRCSVVNAQQITEFSDSNTVVVTSSNPVTNFIVSITGTAQAQQVLTSSSTIPLYDDGTPASPTYTIEWLKDGAAIPGESGTTYTTKLSDAGYRINARYSFTDSHAIYETSLSNDKNIAKMPLTWTNTLAKSNGTITGKIVVSSTFPVFQSLTRRDTIDYSIDNLSADISPICIGSADKKSLTFTFSGTTSGSISNITITLFDSIFATGIKAVNVDPPFDLVSIT